MAGGASKAWSTAKAVAINGYNQSRGVSKRTPSGPQSAADQGLYLSRAFARVSLSSMADQSCRQQEALLNPSSLPIDIDVEVGELNPVGWSHTVLQHGHTKALATSLELYFSAILQSRATLPGLGDEGTFDVVDKVEWLASFCYGSAPGNAPDPLFICWPHTMNIAAVVKKFHNEYIRFARNLTPLVAKVTLTCSELRFSYKTADWQRKNGFRGADPLFSAGRADVVGLPANFLAKAGK